MKLIFLNYILYTLFLVSTAGLLSGCKANKCDCPSFHGKAVAEQVEQC